jgi:hypothetical protein
LSPAWESAASQLKNDLKSLGELDRCAVVTLLPAGAEMIVQVVLADGRSAVRHVRRAEDLVSTIEALLLLPPAAAYDSPPAPPPAMAPEPTPETSTIGSRSAPTQHTPAAAQVELGFGGNARTSGTPLFWGAGAMFVAQLALDGWLIGTEGHWDVFDAPVTLVTPGGFNMQTVGIGAAAGRRIENGALRFDILVGPELLVENEEADGTGDGVGGTSNDVRLHLTTRLLGARAKSPRWFGAFDADASPARFRRSLRMDSSLPQSPAWSAGLGVGLLWEVR